MSYTNSHLEDFIQKVYHDLNIYSPSELNIYTIADALSIGLYPISTSSQAIQFEGRHYIFLNGTLTAPERFETFGHELGHILLHTGNQQIMSENYRVYQEWKANLFALHFCVPTFMLQTIETPDAHKVSEIFGVSLDFSYKRLDMYKQRLHFIELNKHLQSTFK